MAVTLSVIALLIAGVTTAAIWYLSKLPSP